MCGITAIFSPSRGVRAEELARATARLHHRGPDGQRTWVSPDHRAGLGHARLSIIDLTTGTQPIANETEGVQVVVNGEFYDYERIQRELEGRGHKLRTRSDSEIVLHLYEELGTRCLHSLRGEFAFALWDGPGQTLFAARDRFGIKPLFYAWHQGSLYLASEAKALFAAGVPARWDPESFYQCSSLYLEADRSMFEGVYQVPPGHFILATPHHFQVLRYWDFDYPMAGAEPVRSEAEQIERLRHELAESVRLRLRADVPVGCYLSGGIDSCAILGLASQARSEPIDAYTICFEGEGFNEEALAQEMATQAGARFHPLRITSDQMADSFSDAVFHSEVLPSNENGVAKFLLSRLVHQLGNRVVLTGEGSDEIFAGYAHYRRDVLLYNRQGQDPAAVPGLLADLEKSNAVSRGTLFPAGDSLDLGSVKSALGFVPSWMEAFAAVGAKLRGMFSDDFSAGTAHLDPFKQFLNRMDVEGQLAGREPVHQSLYLWSKTYLPNYMLCWLGDRMEMAHSVEGRVPFLDHHVVEAVVSMPVSMKIRGMVEKYVLREAVRPVITQSVYSRAKHPFTAPSSSLRPTERLHQMVQDVLRGPLLRELPFFSQQKVVALLDRLPAMDDAERHVWGFPLTRVLGACLIHKRFGL